MSKIKIGLKQVGSTVFGMVLEQDESLRGNLDLSVNDFNINSCIAPALSDDTLFVRGGHREEDNNIFGHEYETPQKALDVYNYIAHLVRRINEDTDSKSKSFGLNVIE